MKMNIENILNLLDPINIGLITNDTGFNKSQLAKHIVSYETEIPNLDNADIIIVGCNEYRGLGKTNYNEHGANLIRKELYNLYHWHKNLTIMDIGNIKTGGSLQDSYSAIRMVLSVLLNYKKKLIIIGGSHDLTIPQYQSYKSWNKLIDGTIIDAKIDFDIEGNIPAYNFLEHLFTSVPNHLRHYNHIGFQSYCTHPDVIETIDKLRFDCYRLGKVRESIIEMEPIFRSSDFVSIDISAIRYADAPANINYPNGFYGEEICNLMQYAGMSHSISTLGIYSYLAELDIQQLTAKQIAQMIWYYIDGYKRGQNEKPLTDKNNFEEFKTALVNLETIFLRSKITRRWWVQLSDKTFIPCSYNDYLAAQNNEIPERWLREIERRS